MDILKLVNEAKDAQENAYVPYSNYRVGAAILTKNGNIYKGCNVENSSFETTMCAERVAIFNAISEGEREFEAIAIVGDPAILATPCGSCRQVLAEFMPDGKVIVVNPSGEYETFTVNELLPHKF